MGNIYYKYIKDLKKIFGMYMFCSLLQVFGYLGSSVEKNDRISDEGKNERDLERKKCVFL